MFVENAEMYNIQKITFQKLLTQIIERLGVVAIYIFLKILKVN